MNEAHRNLRAKLVLCCCCFGGAFAYGQTNASPPAPATAELNVEPRANCEKAARDHVFDDLADLGRYAAGDAALSVPAPRDRRVVFMGDSITEFWATRDPAFFTRPQFINRGISGQTTLQMLLRFRQDVVALAPAVVHILAGTNDIAGNTGSMDIPTIEANIASMVDLARANNIQVVIGSILPAADFPWRRGLTPGPKILALDQWLQRYSKAMHLIYVDYYSAMTDGGFGMRSDLSPDGVHPSAAGYLIMDNLAEAAIGAALRRRLPNR
jgi:acyl-CoA thioesterase I